MNADETVADEWLEATLETLYENFKAGRGVTLKGFGGFYVQPMKSDGMWVVLHERFG